MKSKGTAYLFWLIGLHRFYLGRPLSAIAQALLPWSNIVNFAIGFSFEWFMFTIVGTIAWYIIDLFLIPRMVRHENKLFMQEFGSFTKQA